MNLDQILNGLTTLPLNDLTAAAAFVGAGGAISVILQFLRHWKGWTSFTREVETHATAWSRLTLTVLTFCVSAAQYIMNHGQGPLWATLTKHAAFLFVTAHAVYWIATQPAYKWFTTLLTDAGNYRQLKEPQPTSVAEAPANTFQV